jgi:hypothetical protein
VSAADDLAARAKEQAELALSDVEHLHREDGTRIFVTAAASTTLAILAVQAELREARVEQTTSLIRFP